MPPARVSPLGPRAGRDMQRKDLEKAEANRGGTMPPCKQALSPSESGRHQLSLEVVI